MLDFSEDAEEHSTDARALSTHAGDLGESGLPVVRGLVPMDPQFLYAV